MRGCLVTLLLHLAARPVLAEQPEPDPPFVITHAPPRSDRVATAPTEEQRAGLLRRLREARQALTALGQTGTPLPSVTRYALSAEIDRLQRLLNARHPTCNPSRSVSRLERDLAHAAAGEAPHLKPGLHRLAYRSPLDRALHSFVVHVPASHGAGKKRLPLVVMLHGMRSNPMRAMGRLFGVADEQLKEHHVTCDQPKVSGHDVLVVAPEAFGDSFYRLAGERDVRTVVQMMTRLYRVDRKRISITGLSMGGTGAVEIALQHPHLYAGVVALCGYYDRRLDSRIRGQPLQPWERHLMTVHSPVDWAANGSGIDLVLIHGSRDGPERARAMERSYAKLGYPVKVELHERGHDVWVPGYAAGRALGILARFRKGSSPARVTFASARPRNRRGHWVLIEAWQDYAGWARVDAEITDPRSVRVTTKNVAALRLDLPAFRLARGKPVSLAVDGDSLELPPQRNRWVRRVRLRREPGGWVKQPREDRPRPGLAKRPGLSGPIEDIYYDPIVVVYGTGGGQAASLRRVAKQIARRSRHVSLEYSVMPDRNYRPRSVRRRSVILLGNERNNSVLARLGPSLPIRVLGGEVRVGSRSLRRKNIGATFVHPNPDSPGWYLLVVGGTTPESYKLWRKLPAMLPDYVVFDDGVEARRSGMVLGGDRTLVEAGYFDSGWKLP